MVMATQTFIRVMTITHAEFFRSLSPLKKYYSYKPGTDSSSISISDGLRQVKIKLGPENVKKLGALKMPVTEVEFIFTGFSSTELDEFWRLFDLCFRRGGG